MILKECQLSSIRDCMKIEYFGYGIFDSDYMNKSKEFRFTNGNA